MCHCCGKTVLYMKLTTLCFPHIVLNYKTDYLSVYHETASVVWWFTLGLYLKLSPTELDIINADFRFQSKPARREMLAVWLKTGNATWSCLFRALSKMGLRSLGKEIANRKGCLMIFVNCANDVCCELTSSTKYRLHARGNRPRLI